MCPLRHVPCPVPAMYGFRVVGVCPVRTEKVLSGCGPPLRPACTRSSWMSPPRREEPHDVQEVETLIPEGVKRKRGLTFLCQCLLSVSKVVLMSRKKTCHLFKLMTYHFYCQTLWFPVIACNNNDSFVPRIVPKVIPINFYFLFIGVVGCC